MRKVALVVNTLSSGGAEKLVSKLSLNFPETVSTDVILNDPDNVVYPYKGELISLNMPPEADRMSLWYQLRLMFRRTSALRRLKHENRYDAVISFSESANIANILSGRAVLADGRRTKRILSVQSSIMPRTKTRRIFAAAGLFLMKLLYNRADCVVPVSREIGEELREKGGVKEDKIRVIYIAADRNDFVIVPFEKADFEAGDLIGEKLRECREEGVPVLCSVGRLTMSKGQWHMLRALADLKEQGKSFFLFLMGDGKLRETLEKMTEELGLSGNVMICGFVKKPYRYLQYADMEICPSLCEGCSTVLLEALAMGIPVVSTDHQTGAREILAPGTDHRTKCTEPEEAEYGILTPVCDDILYLNGEPLTKEEKQLEEAIRKMLDDKELRLKYREKGLGRTDIFMDKITEEWMELIREDKQ